MKLCKDVVKMLFSSTMLPFAYRKNLLLDISVSHNEISLVCFKCILVYPAQWLVLHSFISLRGNQPHLEAKGFILLSGSSKIQISLRCRRCWGLTHYSILSFPGIFLTTELPGGWISSMKSRAIWLIPCLKLFSVPSRVKRCWAALKLCANIWAWSILASSSSTTSLSLASTTGMPKPCGSNWTRKPVTETMIRGRHVPTPR